MKAWIAMMIAAALAGCSGASKEATGIKAFMESCNVPVTGKITLSTFSNSVELNCAEFKRGTKAKAEEQQG